MFVVQTQNIIYGAIQKKIKSLYDKGTREFKKLISFLSLRDRLGLQRVPLYVLYKLSEMQTRKRESKPIIKFNSMYYSVIQLNII